MTKKEFDIIENKAKELHRINFGDDGIIRIKDFNENTCSFEEFCNNHPVSKDNPDKDPCYNATEICGYCEKCVGEETKPKSSKDEDTRLCNISHGSHSLDFLESIWDRERIERELKNDWDVTPTLFLMENPSYDYGIYTYLSSDTRHEGKRPSKKWYWIHRMNNENDFDGDKYLRSRQYGEMVLSLIKQNKLANAYLTNVIKCGMSNYNEDEGSVIETEMLGTDKYTDACKKKCISEILAREVRALLGDSKQLKVFAFGGNAYWMVKAYLISQLNNPISFLNEVSIQLIQMPHPAGHLKDSYRAVLLNGLIEKAKKDNSFGRINASFINIESIQKSIAEKGFPIRKGKQRAKDSLVLVPDILTNALFHGESDIIKGVAIRSDTNRNILDGNYDFGYSIEEDVFWIWDGDAGRPVETLVEGRLSECFKAFCNAIEKCKGSA